MGLLLLVALAMVVAGCGGDSDTASVEQEADEAPAAEEARGAMDDAGAGSAGGDDSAGRGEGSGVDRAGGEGGDGDAEGTAITVGDSEFGRMLFGANDQAIYIFENDSRDETVCYGQCAEDWPPVYTDGEPEAGNGVKQSLLGSIERRDDHLQVTYDGQPLYFYANEPPGEVRCHNVNLNGGLWWAVGTDGNRLP